MRLLLCLLFMGLITTINAQPYRFDNKLFTNIFPEDLCRTLENNPNYLIIDVRSPGEFADTTGFDASNIGRLKGAINIPVNELGTRWKEIASHKDKPVFLYCSHSQRSRRASRLLSDSGFVKVFNINGGMSRLLAEKDSKGNCLGQVYTSALPFKWITARVVMEQTGSKNPYFIIDVRSDSAYDGKSTSESINHLGKIKGALHIPETELGSSLSKIPKDKPLLLIDAQGDDVARSAKLLIEAGYSQVYALYGGLEDWIEAEILFPTRSVINHQSNSPFKIIGPDQVIALMADERTLILDIRSQEVYENRSPNAWENIGRLKRSVNVPAKDWEDGKLLSDRKTPILIYSMSSDDVVFKTAQKIRSLGFKNIHILQGGLWQLRRNANNLKGRDGWNDLVVEVPEANK